MNVIVTCSDDGSIKIYDGVSGQCVNTIEQGMLKIYLTYV